jgi:hypothetical protein
MKRRVRAVRVSRGGGGGAESEGFSGYFSIFPLGKLKEVS